MVANSEVVAGIDTYILYGAESAYGTAVSASSSFGGLIQSSPFEVDRQIKEWPGFAGTGTGDGRVTAKFTPGQVRVSASVEFYAQRFDFLQYVLLGARTGSGTTLAPYSYPIGTSTKSLTVTEEIDNAGTDSQRTYAGMVINDCSIRCSVGEPVSVTLGLLGGKIAKDTVIGSKVAQLTDDLYNFSGGSIEMPDATPIGNIIESVDISINNNYEIKYGFNQEAVNAKPMKLSMSVRFSTNYLDDDQMDKLMGSSTAITTPTPVTLTLKFTRATAGAQYAYFKFTNVVISRIGDSHSLNQFMVEDTDILASGLTVLEVQS